MTANDEPNGAAAAPLGSRLGADLWPRVAAAVALGLAALAVAWVGGFRLRRLLVGGVGRSCCGNGSGSCIATGSSNGSPWARSRLRSRRSVALNGWFLGAAAALVAGAAAVGWIAGPTARIAAGAGVALRRRSRSSASALLRASPSYGLPAILWLFAVVWGTDVAAYFAGRLIGGPRLWPSVSPGKTWSGAIAGAFAGAALGLLLAGWTNRIDRLFWLGLAAAVVSRARRPVRIGAQAAVRRQGFEPPHPRPRRPHGQARRLHRRVRFRRRLRRRQFEGLLHRQRTVPMVSRRGRRPRGRSRARRTRPKRLAILGATGSIGRSCARVIGAAPGRFAVASVAVRARRRGARAARCRTRRGIRGDRRSGRLRRSQGGARRLRRRGRGGARGRAGGRAARGGSGGVGHRRRGRARADFRGGRGGTRRRARQQGDARLRRRAR